MILPFDAIIKKAKASRPLIWVLLTALPVLVPIIVFFTFNMLTPFWWDDFVMGCFMTTWQKPNTVLLSSFSDVVTSTYNMYQIWHGRSVADFINFFFMFLRDKNIFNVCNTVVYCVFVLLIGFHVTGSFRKISGLLFMFINILLWLVLPVWGQNLLWLTGSCNYLWTGAIILLFLVPFRKKAENFLYRPHIAISLLWIVAGVLAGWSMENSASGAFVLLAAYFVLKRRRKEPVVAFEILGSLGFLIGFFMLMRARHGLFPGFWDLIINAVKVGFSFIFLDALLLGAIIFLAIELIRYRKARITAAACGFFLAGLASVAAMIMPGYFDGRSAFITQVFLVITLLSLFMQIKQFLSGKVAAAAGVMLLLAFLPSFYTGSNEIVKGFLIAHAREQYILSEKQNGNLKIEVKAPIMVLDSHSGMYDGMDIFPRADVDSIDYIVHNSAKVTWYGIESLDGIPTFKRQIRLKATIGNFLNRRKAEGLSVNDLFTMIYEDW